MQDDHSDGEPGDRKPPRFDINDYRETSFVLLAKLIAGDPKAYISGEMLAAALRANRGKPVPDAVLDYICLHLEGKVRKPAGRKRSSDWESLCLSISAAHHYQRYFGWLRRRRKSLGLKGLTCMRKAHWWKGAPGERAARIVAARFFPHLDYRHVQNLVSEWRSPK